MDREKVIKGLELCQQGFDCPSDCPYLDDCNDLMKPMFIELAKDALELLKEYKRQDGCPCTHCMEWECDEVCEEYKKWKDT